MLQVICGSRASTLNCLRALPTRIPKAISVKEAPTRLTSSTAPYAGGRLTVVFLGRCAPSLDAAKGAKYFSSAAHSAPAAASMPAKIDMAGEQGKIKLREGAKEGDICGVQRQSGPLLSPARHASRMRDLATSSPNADMHARSTALTCSGAYTLRAAMDWEPAEAPLEPPIAAQAVGEAPDARVTAADSAGGAAAHTPACTADMARSAGRLSDSGGTATAVNLMTAGAFLTPPAAPALKSSLKRRAPASAPPGVAPEDAVRCVLQAARLRWRAAEATPPAFTVCAAVCCLQALARRA
jgi:hypothetical protein